MHAPLRLGRAVSQRYDQQSAGLEQGDKLTKRPWPIGGREMHPNGTQQNQVEGDAEAQRRREIRQAIV
jgi:hypothetical protein